MIKAGNFLVYKSSAGSGKTFTLARTYLGLTLGSADFNYFRKILAVTFTVKAAAEMKERILSYLSALSGASKRKDTHAMLDLLVSDTGLTPETIRERSGRVLHAILHNYSDFSILTIDKFAHRLIRTFSGDLELTPDFEVEIDQARINDMVVESLIGKAGQNEDITQLILQFIEHQVSEDKTWNIENNILETANELNSEEFFLRSASFREIKAHEVPLLKAAIEKEITHFETRLTQLGKTALEAVGRAGLGPEDFFYGNSGIYGYFEAIHTRNYRKFAPNSWVQKTINEGKWQSGTKNPAVNGIVSALETTFHEIQHVLSDVPRINFLRSLRGAVFTMGMIGELRELFQAVKADENIQTLADFYRLLSSRFAEEQAPFIYERLGNRYAHILIDEFQDTSALQWQNIVPLVENTLSEGKISLIVGDAKQSIYRFRGSEPEQFLRLPTVGRQSDHLFAAEYREEALNINYRSSRNVVDFNNRFFEALSARVLDERFRDIYSDLKQTAASQDNGSVRVRLISDEGDPDKRELFLDHFDRCIEGLLKQQLEQRDICLLFHRNADAAYMASGLLKRGYRVVSEESLLLSHNPEIQLLMATLYAHRFAEDPFYQQRWLSRLLQTGLLQEPYHATAQSLKKNKQTFKNLVKSLKLNLDIRKLEHGDSFSMLYYLAGVFGFDREGPFITRLLDFALDFEQSATYLKHSFLTHWETQQEKLSISLQEGQNALRIMTIHKSKGLEFPAVLLYLPELRFDRHTRDYAWLSAGINVPGLEVALMKVQQLKDTPFQTLYEEERIKSTLDKMNTLYVALTRAQRHLEIFTLEKDGQPKSAELQFITGWPEWDAQNRVLDIH